MRNVSNFPDVGWWLAVDRIKSGEESYDRALATTGGAQSSQSLRLCYFTARKSEAITQARVETSSTAAGATPSLIRIGIWTADDAGALLSLVASTPNDTTLLATINTAYAKALSATWDKVAGQRYAAGLLVVTAATAPTVAMSNPAITAATSALAPKLAGLIGGSADLPASAAAGSVAASGARPFFVFLP